MRRIARRGRHSPAATCLRHRLFRSIELKPVHFATCAWGPWHLEMLTRVVWPCLLASGNLPAFMRECRATYRICTTRRDQYTLRQAAAFPPISNMVPIEFIDTPTENRAGFSYGSVCNSHAGCQRGRGNLFQSLARCCIRRSHASQCRAGSKERLFRLRAAIVQGSQRDLRGRT